MKALKIIIVILFLILASMVLFFYKDKIVTQNNQGVPTDSSGVRTQQTNYSFLEEKDFYSSTSVESYKVGDIEFKIYPKVDEPYKEGWFEIYKNNSKEFSSEPVYKVSSLLSFSLGENKYVLVNDYSGGAHCCTTSYLFRINKSNEIKLIKTLDMGNAMISKDSLLFKDNALYFVLTDDSFGYFHASYAYSYFFQQYYQLEGDTLVLANNNFTEELLRTGDDCRDRIANDPVQPDEDGNYWLKDVLCYVANYTLAGKQNVAIADFNGFFNKFFPSGSGKDAFGEVINREKLKQEIVDVLKDDRFK